MIEIKKLEKEYIEDVGRIAYHKYGNQMYHLGRDVLRRYEEFMDWIKPKIEKAKGYVALVGGRCVGYMSYFTWEDDHVLYCSIPVWGYGAESSGEEKYMSRLFQRIAEDTVKAKSVQFMMNVYAYDVEIQRLFSYMEFGMQSEKCMRKLSRASIESAIPIRIMPKDELKNRWTEVWGLVSQIVEHLKKSPVFYSGDEFTEEVYLEFFEDENTTVYVAEVHGEIVGLIETNRSSDILVFGNQRVANIGEVFVVPRYRGTMLAKDLLVFAENNLLDCEFEYDWVEHGTANPNARGFWNKYFDTYQYEMIRKINKE